MKMSMQISVGGGRYVTQYDVRQRKESHQKKKGKREKQGMPSCQVVLPRSTVQGSTAQAASKISQLTQLDLTQFNSTQLEVVEDVEPRCNLQPATELEALSLMLLPNSKHSGPSCCIFHAHVK